MRVVQQGDIRFGKRRQLKKKRGEKREARGLRAPACVCSCSWIVSPLALLLLDRFSCLLFLDRLSRLLFLDSLLLDRFSRLRLLLFLLVVMRISREGILHPEN